MISVCPHNPKSIELVIELVTQTMQIIGKQNVQFFHIGADKVFNLATCPQCSLFVQETSTSTLYTKFVRKVVTRLQLNYPSVKFIIWDDMFRSWSVRELDQLKVKGKNAVEPCIWNYLGDPQAFI